MIKINDLWTRGCEDDWKRALNRYYDRLKPEQKELDHYLENIEASEIKKLSPLEFYLFLYEKYFLWKYTAKNRLATTRKFLHKYVDQENLLALKRTQKKIFCADHNDIEDCLKITTEIKGLGIAGASGLLSILFPEKFGTVDQFVIKALAKISDLPYRKAITRMNPGVYINIKNGTLLIKILREKAAELNEKFNTDFWTPRRIDMVLWSVER